MKHYRRYRKYLRSQTNYVEQYNCSNEYEAITLARSQTQYKFQVDSSCVGSRLYVRGRANKNFATLYKQWNFALFLIQYY